MRGHCRVGVTRPRLVREHDEDHYIADSLEALRTLITDIKAGKADHLLRTRRARLRQSVPCTAID
ncbi:hypothetical protein [Streptomyces capparidis]